VTSPGESSAPAAGPDARWVSLGPASVQVTRGVFPPQSDTLALIEWCQELLRDRPRPVIADLCTGSGVIAIALAASHPSARLYAVDISDEAVRLATINAARLTGAMIVVRRGDAADPRVLADIAGAADLVVANPPYLPDRQPAPPDLATWAVPAALHGGPDGLDVIRGVVAVAAVTLRSGGWLAVEHAAGQQHRVIDIIGAAGVFDCATGHRDHAAIRRFVTAQRT